LRQSPGVAALRVLSTSINHSPGAVGQRKLAEALRQRSQAAGQTGSRAARRSRGVTSGQYSPAMPVQREDGDGAATPGRTVEGAGGVVTLPPLTLLDFMQAALVKMRARDRARAEARAQAKAEAQKEKEREERRREAEEAARREEEERQRLEALEAQRREAEERLRQEEERLRREEEEERRRVEAEQKKEAKRAAAEKQWKEAMQAIAETLVQQLRVKLSSVWAHLTADEQRAALEDVAKVAETPSSERGRIESQVRKPSRRAAPLQGEALWTAVLKGVESRGAEAVGAWAAKLGPVGASRAAAAEHQAKVSEPVTPTALVRLTTTEIPSGNELMELYRAAAQGQLVLNHEDTYRTQFELKEKKGSQHGPFSREFSARIYGTDPRNPGRYVWCTWVVHVHFKTSGRPTEIEYLHLKKRADRKRPIAHVFNKHLEDSLSPLVMSSVNATVDESLPDFKKK
jgi:hypothetical protein